jgi:hypothetical protein
MVFSRLLVTGGFFLFKAQNGFCHNGSKAQRDTNYW